ncbi:MAG: hypothetical protein AAF485_27775, partial [Chloroflexota bacterium]
DLHWADSSSIRLLSYLGEAILDEHPLFLIGTYRPEEVALGPNNYPHPLADVIATFETYLGNIRLDLRPTNEVEALKFIDEFLDTNPNRLDETFRQAMFQRTGGHPLFTIELLQDLQARGDLYQDETGCWIEGPNLNWNTLPSGLEGVLQARVSQLNKNLQNALTTASIEGEIFTAEVVAKIQGLDEDLLTQQLTHQLQQEYQLVSPHGIQQHGDQTLSLFRFRHNLIQQYLYNSLGSSEQVSLHEKVGCTLETIYGDYQSEITQQLAWHFQKAGLIERAMGYWRSAGDDAAQIYATAEAVTCYTHELSLAINQATDIASEVLIDIYLRLGRMLELNDQFFRALDHYREMELMAKQRNDPALALNALVQQGQIRSTPNEAFDQEEGKTLLKRALHLAQEVGDQMTEVRLLWNFVNLYRYLDYEQSIYYGEQGLALAEEFELWEQLAYIHNDLAYSHITYGYFREGGEAFHEATLLWRKVNNLPMLTDSLSGASSVYVFMGEYERAIALSDEAFQLSQSIDNLWGQSFSRHTLGLIYWNQGKLSQAIRTMEACIRNSEEAGFIVPQIYTRAYLALIHGSLGDLNTAFPIAELALKRSEIFPPFRLASLGILIELCLLNDDIPQAKSYLAKFKQSRPDAEYIAYDISIFLGEIKLDLLEGEYQHGLAIATNVIEKLKQLGIDTFLAEFLYYQAQLLFAQDKRNEAYQALLKAEKSAKQLGNQRMLWLILSDISDYLDETGQESQATIHRNQAQVIIQA